MIDIHPKDSIHPLQPTLPVIQDEYGMWHFLQPNRFVSYGEANVAMALMRALLWYGKIIVDIRDDIRDLSNQDYNDGLTDGLILGLEATTGMRVEIVPHKDKENEVNL